MSKIICEVCGSRYPDTSVQCPICGCVNSKAGKAPEVAREPIVKTDLPERTPTAGGRFSKSNVNKRNQGKVFTEEPAPRAKPVAKREKPQVSAPVPEEYDLEEAFEEETGKKRGGFVNVLLVMIILALLAVCAYIFLQYLMPSFFGSDPVFGPEPTVAATEAPTEAPAPTLPPNIPCEKLAVEEKTVTLTEAGQVLPLNIQVKPENSTDGLIYISSNENVAAVSEDGNVTAVGEGSVVITVFCGAQQLECNVICNFSGVPAAEPETQPSGGASANTDAPAATEAPAQTGEKKKVTSNTLNVRKEASSKSDKVGSFKKGDEITIYEQKKVGSQYWGRTDNGWVCMDYVK